MKQRKAENLTEGNLTDTLLKARHRLTNLEKTQYKLLLKYLLTLEPEPDCRMSKNVTDASALEITREQKHYNYAYKLRFFQVIFINIISVHYKNLHF